TPERLQKRANRLWIWAVITQPVFSLAFQNQQPWWALNILFVFAGVTQLLALQYRHGRKGMLAGYLLLALMIWPLQPASYGLAGITLAISMATVSGSDTPGVQRLAAITAVLSLICLNGLSHLLDMPAETLLLATLPTLAFPLAVVSFCRQICPEGRRRFMPRNFFYYAYAGHLGIIGLVQTTFG
ncbi:conjugal transfer protein TraX, partial [Enterobacter cloacae subsp. cloacae]